MIKIRTLEVAGIGPAIHAMRNPYDSWAKSDTHQGHIGEKDRELSERLSNAGTEHCKHLRLIEVWAEIEAPLYWWKEFDTYRVGVEKLSCSTMHTIHSKQFEQEDFSCENLSVYNRNLLGRIIDNLNSARAEFIKSDKTNKDSWWQLIQMLPSSYNQRRTVMMSYAALRQICKQRKGHKLTEWHVFRDWAFGLPEGWMIGENDKTEKGVNEDA
jgi:hypothetical protein